ncbi:hypothetical protein ACN38_g1757 [Penicillium nordicum]|uniref:Uncharacterized protein n=1 Tax=Penicillium nordicum TaxID=229535 RepID=A0A0M9WJI9_9EURO|nr:hypothetical protein ACN38_g1757 [Penicillium nordicum]
MLSSPLATRAFSLLARSSTPGRANLNASTSSCTAQLRRSLSSWSELRHAGHLPSVLRQRRIHSEQNRRIG